MRYLLSALLAMLLIHPASATTITPPQRVVALSWEATEYLLTLGITPLAVADKSDYQTWVVQPTLPKQVLGAGGRMEPNLEQLVSLKPDLIIINPALTDLKPTLERIAPTLLLDAYRSDHDNEAASYRIQRELAVLFGKTAQLDQLLAAQKQRFSQLKSQLAAHYQGQLPKICVIRFATPTTVWVYGENSMPLAAMRQLGLESACPQPKTAWGTAQRKLTELGKIQDGIVLHVLPFNQMAKLSSTPIWQAMPFVKKQNFLTMRSTWTNGGVYSIGLLAEAMSEALQETPSRH